MHLRPRKRTIVVAATAGVLALGAPAAYASDDILSDIVSNNDVSVPVNACDINANVIGGEVNNDEAAKCQNNVDQSGDTSEDGGDNVLSDIVSNNDASVPVNLCDVNANVIGGEVNNDEAAKCQNNVDQGGGHKKH